MHKFRSWVYLFIAVGNVAITIPLVKAYGGIGAAMGTAIALVVGNIFIMNWYYHYRVGLNIRWFTKQVAAIIPSLILPAIAGVAMMLYLDLSKPLLLIPGIFAYTLLFIASVWFWGMNAYEKDLALKPIQKLLSKTRKRS